MQVTKRGLELLKAWEAMVLKVYKDAAGLPTIGVGHLLRKSELATGIIKILGKPVSYAKGITEAQALDLLAQDLDPAEAEVSTLVKVPLQPWQFDCLASFTFNCGEGAFQSSTLLKELNQGKYYLVPQELRKWTHAGGKVNKGLIQRREKEIKRWQNLI